MWKTLYQLFKIKIIKYEKWRSSQGMRVVLIFQFYNKKKIFERRVKNQRYWWLRNILFYIICSRQGKGGALREREVCHTTPIDQNLSWL